MPDFQYTAREISGQQVAGVISATSEREVITSLANKQLFPIAIELADEAKSQQQSAGRRVRAAHLVVFYSQLSDLLRSGVPLLRSLEILERQTNQVTLKLVIQNIREQVADGTRLAEAMRRHPKVFSELVVSMVRAGEEGSFLEDVLKRIATFTEHQEDLKNRVVGAMAYPIFLMAMGGLIVVAMLVFFVPKFQPIFDRLSERGELPWATKTLLTISNTTSDYGVPLAIAALFAAVFVSQWLKTEKGRRSYDWLRISMKGLGPVVRSLAIARFCRILGTLLRNGVTILHSLRIAKDATGNMLLSEAVGDAADSVSAGKALADPLRSSKQFPEEVVEMIAVGEEANNLEQVLIDVAENMERRTYRHLELFVRLLEPMMLLVMAAIILFVVAALLLPVFQSSGAL